MRTFIDPPEVRLHEARVDPPVEGWPGAVFGRRNVMAAGGHPKEWFRYWHRMNAVEESWAEFIDARQRRRNMSAGFEWNQVLIIGQFGAKKSTLAMLIGRHYFGLGHPFFANATSLIGWRVQGSKIYTVMGFMPMNAILFADETSAVLSRRLGHGVAVSSFLEMGLNIRKLNIFAMFASAQPHLISGAIRNDCREVWLPVDAADVTVEDDAGAPGGRIEPANDPANFVLAWHVWDDYPYRRGSGPEEWGEPAYTMVAQGDEVRRAYLLNDSFELAAAGTATTADREGVKGDLESFLEGRIAGERLPGDTIPVAGSDREQADGIEGQESRLLSFFANQEDERPDTDDDNPVFFRAGELGTVMGVAPGRAGVIMQGVVPIEPVRRRGYRAKEVYKKLKEMNGETPR